MPTLPAGASHLVCANQWHEEGYKIVDGRVVDYFVDRKDPQYCEGAPRTADEMLADPAVAEPVKQWLRLLGAGGGTAGDGRVV